MALSWTRNLFVLFKRINLIWLAYFLRISIPIQFWLLRYWQCGPIIFFIKAIVRIIIINRNGLIFFCGLNIPLFTCILFYHFRDLAILVWIWSGKWNLMPIFSVIFLSLFALKHVLYIIFLYSIKLLKVYREDVAVINYTLGLFIHSCFFYGFRIYNLLLIWKIGKRW